MLEKPRARIELVRRFAAPRADIPLGPGLPHEAAADAVILLSRQYTQRRIVRSEAHAVGMSRQHLVRVEQEIERLVKGDFVLTQQTDTSLVAYPFERRVGCGGVDR